MSEPYRILALNLGSTSTRIGVYENDRLVHGDTIRHPAEELARFESVFDQYEYRRDAVLAYLASIGETPSSMDILVARGGNVRPVPGGIYLVSEEMLQDMYSGRYGVHPNCNGNRIIFGLGQEYGIPAIFVDPPVTDEFCAEARVTGLPDISRQSSGHALNQKATARKIAAELGTVYEKVNLIVCHLGGGISVGAHRRGKLVDMNNALDGDGPMSPERAGTLPTGALVDLCYSGRFSHAAMRKRLTGRGGWMAHLGTADARVLLERVQAGEHAAAQVYNATIYQIGKEIAAMAAVLRGEAQGIGITGAMARSDVIVDDIKGRTAFLGLPYFVYPGENEMEALCAGALRFLRGEEQAAPYGAGTTRPD